MRHIEATIVNPLLGTLIDLPEYATPGAAAMDLRACIEQPIALEPGQRVLIKTGLALNMMDTGMAAHIASRSGLALKHGIRAHPGLIDSDYTGEVGVILFNLGQEPYTIQPGERIAQLTFAPVFQVKLHYVDKFSIETTRGAGGFGSTGKA